MRVEGASIVMPIGTIVNEVGKFLDNLTATNPVCVALGTSLTGGSNLFEWEEPPEATQMISIIPYGGSPPKDEDKQEGAIQLKVKAKTSRKSGETTQALINLFHKNGNICASSNGIFYANQSIPIPLPSQEGGEWHLSVSNYLVKYVKL